MDTQNKWPLYIAIGLPVLFIAGLIGAVYIPQLFAKPAQYDFLYAVRNSNEYYGQTYVVEKGKIVKRYLPPPVELKPTDVKNYQAVVIDSIYLYEVASDKSRELTLEEAQALNLDQNPKAPDGYMLTGGQTDGGLITGLFGGNRDYNARYLKNGFYSKQIYLTQADSRSYYYGPGGINFLGWVIK
jgi:hypothetical protein